MALNEEFLRIKGKQGGKIEEEKKKEENKN